MASFEDYDEFGNYIGADLDSDDGEEIPQNAYTQLQREPSVQPLEGFDEDEPMTGADEGALMQVDGMSQYLRVSPHLMILGLRSCAQCCHIA